MISVVVANCRLLSNGGSCPLIIVVCWLNDVRHLGRVNSHARHVSHVGVDGIGCVQCWVPLWWWCQFHNRAVVEREVDCLLLIEQRSQSSINHQNSLIESCPKCRPCQFSCPSCWSCWCGQYWLWAMVISIVLMTSILQRSSSWAVVCGIHHC